jgi:hypothetical protein
MNMPGFNAEAALDSPNGRYQVKPSFTGYQAYQATNTVQLASGFRIIRLVSTLAPYACFAGCSYAGGSDSECDRQCGTAYSIE